MEVPTEGRRLVLCTDHVNDLLLVDQKFKDQYYNYTSGKIANLYGFEVYEYVSCPFFFTTNGLKKSSVKLLRKELIRLLSLSHKTHV